MVILRGPLLELPASRCGSSTSASSRPTGIVRHHLFLQLRRKRWLEKGGARDFCFCRTTAAHRCAGSRTQPVSQSAGRLSAAASRAERYAWLIHARATDFKPRLKPPDAPLHPLDFSTPHAKHRSGTEQRACSAPAQLPMPLAWNLKRGRNRRQSKQMLGRCGLLKNKKALEPSRQSCVLLGQLSRGVGPSPRVTAYTCSHVLPQCTECRNT